MKKKSGSRIGRVFSRIINIRLWFDWERIKSFTSALLNGIKFFFIPGKSKPAETFDNARTKFKLTDEELVIKQRALYRLSILMLVLALGIIGYASYHVFYGTFMAFAISLSVAGIALALAFRYHFWYFQIKHRKLGCSFQEWYKQGILGEKE